MPNTFNTPVTPITPIDTLIAQVCDVTSDAVIALDHQHRVIYFNSGAEQIFGYSAEDVLGQSINLLLPERFRAAHGVHITRFGEGQDIARRMAERREIYGLHKQGHEFPAEAGIVRLPSEGVYAVILRDVAERKHYEAELRTTSTQLAVLSERNRLARELHDAVTQSLFSASLIADALPQMWTQDQVQGWRHLQDIRQLTRNALAEMRTLLLELRPDALTRSKLSDLLKQLAETTTGRSGVQITVEAEEQAQLPAEVQIALYRIGQEAMNNIVKHSGANTASVRLGIQAKSATLLIEDDGCGFVVEDRAGTHLGLRIMQERADEIEAQLQIESQVGTGTTILVIWNSDL